MKSKPKLQDTLEVFLEQLESVQESIKDFKAVDGLLQEKITKIERVRIEPDIRELDHLQQNFQRKTNEIMREMIKIFETYIGKTKEICEKQKKNNMSFYGYIFLFFIVTCAAIYFGVSARFKQSNLKEQLEQKQSYSQTLESFIIESQQVKKYEKWLDAKNQQKNK